jgi:hypothetical protein
MQDLQSKKVEYNSCFYSSFIFLTNTIVAYQYKYYTYSLVFFLLFVTSIIVHSVTNIYTIIIDKVSILLVVLYGGYVFYNKLFTLTTSVQYLLSIIVIVCFLSTIYLYCYGFFMSSYCFTKDIQIGRAYHSLLHFIGSFGHNLIVVL